MFGIDVRVHPLFWLISMMLGWRLAEQLGYQYLLLWVACVFVSILIHELGHVFVGRIFGAYGHIVLYSFGGLAIGSSDLSHRWQRVAVYFAGPLAGFILLGLVELIIRFIDIPRTPSALMLAATLFFLWEINLFWGLMNLLPVWPLDGGQISREVFTWLTPNNGLRVSLGLSIFVAAAIAVTAAVGWVGFIGQDFYLAILFALLAFSSFQMLQQLPPRYRLEEREELAPWERDPDYWKRG
jgi:membrane-associated protease RseP (regulator of RpoE activity)